MNVTLKHMPCDILIGLLIKLPLLPPAPPPTRVSSLRVGPCFDFSAPRGQLYPSFLTSALETLLCRINECRQHSSKWCVSSCPPSLHSLRHHSIFFSEAENTLADFWSPVSWWVVSTAWHIVFIPLELELPCSASFPPIFFFFTYPAPTQRVVFPK